jgi:uncharacterized membrane protein YadS
MNENTAVFVAVIAVMLTIAILFFTTLRKAMEIERKLRELQSRK